MAELFLQGNRKFARILSVLEKHEELTLIVPESYLNRKFISKCGVEIKAWNYSKQISLEF